MTLVICYIFFLWPVKFAYAIYIRRPSSGVAMAGNGGMSWEWGVRLGAVVTTLGHPSNKGPDGAGVMAFPVGRKWLKTGL